MHSETYDFKAIESRWQKVWEESGTFILDDSKSSRDAGKPKFYCLVMFPYPSGKIHMGHARNYCIGDVIARYKKMQGFRVLHPIGWDAFGLPAENAAIQNGVNPEVWTEQNMSDMRQDIKSLGISYDWSREFATCHKEYYRWNQWFFVKMFEKGLAYRKKSAVNWCPQCDTVLANEQVHDGKCWRCETVVTHKDLDQWFFKITEYADRLLQDHRLLEGKWPEEVITMQRNWIGKSMGAEVHFEVAPVAAREKGRITVFTTRPDTLFGCTFLVLSPEHPISAGLLTESRRAEGLKYIEKAKSRTRAERLAPEKDKTGVFTGSHAVNPVNGEKIPVWIADYVLADYGTGAIMSVPAHDQRDFEFAKKYKLPIIEVIQPEKGKTEDLKDGAFEDEGVMVNSGEFSGMPSGQGARKVTEKLHKAGQGKEEVTYRIRDWLISRQRYWGTPIPMLYCDRCGIVPVPEEDLPVTLPKDVQFTGKGRSPILTSKSFVNVKCPKCAGSARRETDTMDTFVDSSWYFLRYVDSKNAAQPFEPEKADAWVPVDQYIGGIEHACMHLIYARFFHKVVQDLGLVNSAEPFGRLLTQGMVTKGGSAMSKSRGNAVPVEDMVKSHGADTARLFVLFASPPRNQLEWSEEGVQGSWRFLNRIWRISRQIVQGREKTEKKNARQISESELVRKTHWTVKKVDEDIRKDFQFNTAISAMMELLNHLSDYSALGDQTSKESLRVLLALLFPFAPHLASQIWEDMGYEPRDINSVQFPSYRADLLQESVVEIVIQVNGKLRSKISLPAGDSREESRVMPLARQSLAEKGLKEFEAGSSDSNRYKFVPGRLVNFVMDQKSNVEVRK